MATSNDSLDVGRRHSGWWLGSLTKILHGVCVDADVLADVSERSLVDRSRGFPKMVATARQRLDDAATASTGSCTSLDHHLADDCELKNTFSRSSDQKDKGGNILIISEEAVDVDSSEVEESESMPIATGIHKRSWERISRTGETLLVTMVAVLFTCVILKRVDRENFGLHFQHRPLSFTQKGVEQELLHNLPSFVNLEQLVQDTIVQVDSSMMIETTKDNAEEQDATELHGNPNLNNPWNVIPPEVLEERAIASFWG